MKTRNSPVKIITLLVLAGALLSSCFLESLGDGGTLLIVLPGGGDDRAAVSQEFTSLLRYRVECTGPGKVSRDFPAGANASIPLAVGDWNIKVSVLNAADEDIALANNTAFVSIEEGKTSSVRMPISIDTTRQEIKSFTILGPGNKSYMGRIDETTLTTTGIHVFVPVGLTANPLRFTAVHTGRSIDPPSGSEQDFSYPLSMNVYSEQNPNTLPKIYVVTVEESDLGYWIPASVLEQYGLALLGKPSAADSDVTAATVNGELNITVTNTNKTVFDVFVDYFLKNKGVLDQPVQIYDGVWTFNSSYSAPPSYTYSVSIMFYSGTVAFFVEPQGSYTPSWPGAALFDCYGISVTQPGSTVLEEVAETFCPTVVHMVVLENAMMNDHDSLREQITHALGNPLEYTVSGIRTAYFSKDNIIVSLTFDSQTNTLMLHASLSL